MKLINCYIENFGMLKEFSCKFDKGLNCIFSDNGTGKTTLTVFIKAMLYGMPETRKALLSENDRKKYLPWQGGRYGGALTLDIGRKRYTIERTFGQKASEDSFTLIDRDTGAVSKDYSENIGEEIFGIDRDGFERTVFLSEKNLSGKNENKSISAKLSDLVGADGDVGGFDAAIALLEDRRRYYYKKGGSGEISNVKTRLTECELAINGLAAKREGAKAQEEAIAQKNERLNEAILTNQAIKADLKKIDDDKHKLETEKTYNGMLASLEKSREELRRTEKFFERGIPTGAQVDAARDKWLEGRRLRDGARSQVSDPKYGELSEFFKNGTSYDEITSASKTADRLTFLADEKAAIKENRDEYSTQIKLMFPNRTPERDEVLENYEKSKKRTSPLFTALAALGCCLILGGVLMGALVHPALYALCAIGGGLLIVGFAKKGGGVGHKEALAFADEIRKEDGTLTERLTSILKDLDRYEVLCEKRADRLSDIEDEERGLLISIYDFLGKFPRVDAPTPMQSIAAIKERFDAYYPMYLTRESSEKNRIESLKKGEMLMKEAADFLSQYPVEPGSDPFEQIRQMIINYNFAGASVHRMESECEDFKLRHGITDREIRTSGESESELHSRLTENEDYINALRKDIALAQRQYDEDMAECERIDELCARRDELEGTLENYKRNLSIIQKTSALLSEACDLMTARYIGKTKESFEKYVSLMSADTGEFSVDTSFTLTKTDRGATRQEESYSRGTRDLYALAMRLALVDSLYGQELPFVILDDPFTAFDGGNLARAKDLVKRLSQDRQIIYFTCSKERTL